MAPTVGRIVHYTLAEYDVSAIRADRAENSLTQQGNPVTAGDVYPAMVVRTWGSDEYSAVQLQVFLDGNHTYWATSRSKGNGPGFWHWPPRA